MLDNSRKILANKKFDTNISNEKYEFHALENISAKKIQFENVSFRYSIITNSYFHQARFINCDFTGCQILQCNFRSAEFITSKFDYAIFTTTILPYNQIIANLPKEENIKKAILQSLIANAEQVGERDYITKLTIEIAKTDRDHYKKAFLNIESYYKEKYKGIKRINCFVKYIELSIKQFLWNHGFSYMRIILFCLFAILMLSILSIARIADTNVNLKTLLKLSMTVFIEGVKIFIDYPEVVIRSYSEIAVVILLIMRYLAIGLIVNVFYIRNAKK